MLRSLKYFARLPGLVLLAVMAQATTGAQAQAPQAAPPGEIVGVGNFAHIVRDLDVSLAFYRDVLGLEVGVTTEFSPNPAIMAMGNTPGAQSRIATLKVPGLALGIELIEYKDIERRVQTPRFVDPGAANMGFRVPDLGALFPAIEQFPGVKILTTGGKPATIETPNGTVHVVFLQDPDGFVVEIIGGAAPAAGAAAGNAVVGSAFEPAVADSAASVEFYNELLGFDFELGAAFNTNQDMAATAGAPGASFRQSRAQIPGTAVPMTLIEFKDIERNTLSGRTQDPGTTVLQLVVRDVTALTAKLKAAGVPIVSVDGKPVEVRPGLKIAIVRDPNNMLLELVERGPQ
jgi:catechol 2,3-dioxygenase-like lactoylglutathione lyase family enzyme